MTLKLGTENVSSSKSPISVSNATFDEIEEFPSAKKSTKCFSGYKKDATSYCIFLPKLSGYIKSLHDIKIQSSFFIEKIQ